MAGPRYDTPQVRLTGMPTPRVGLDTRGTHNEGLAQGLQQAGAAALQGAEALAQVQRQELEKANAKRAMDAEALLQDSTTQDVETVLQARGEDAYRAADTWAERQKKRMEEAGKLLQNDEQRALFTARSRSLMRSADVQVRRHLAQASREAEVATMAARQDASLRALTLGFADGEARTLHMAAPEAGLRAFAPTPEAGEAAVQAWRAKAHTVVLEQYMVRGDVDGASAYFSSPGVREALGPASGRVQHELEVRNRARAAEVDATRLLSASRVEGYPWLDADKALAQVETLAPGPHKDEVRQRVEHLVGLAERRKAAAGKEKYNEALAIWGKTRNRSSPDLQRIKAWMLDANNGAADLWTRFERDRDHEVRQWRVSNAEARRQQAIIDDMARSRYLQMDPEARVAEDLPSFYAGQGVSPQALERLKAEQAKDKRTLEKGEGVGLQSFYKTLGEDVERSPGLRGKRNEAAAGAYKARLGEWYRQRLDETNKPPTQEQIDAERARMQGELLVKGGGFLGLMDSRVPRYLATPEEEARGVPVGQPAPEEAPPARPAAQGGSVSPEQPPATPAPAFPEDGTPLTHAVDYSAVRARQAAPAPARKVSTVEDIPAGEREKMERDLKRPVGPEEALRLYRKRLQHQQAAAPPP